MMANRVVAFEGTPQAMRGSEDRLVQQFLNGSPDGPVSFHYSAPPLLEVV